MKNKKNLLIALNSILATAFIYTLIESATYYGFLAKHVGNLVYIFISIIALVFVFVLIKLQDNSLVSNLIYICTGGMLLTYLVLNALEKLKYPNYVFSHFHLHPEMLLLPLIMLLLIFLFTESEIRVKNLFYILIFLVFCQYLASDLATVKGKSVVYVFKNMNLNYDKKMEILIGKIPYDYAIFIKENTPENATILIPPQAYPWPQTSNEAYLRYFIYPRKLINGGERSAQNDLAEIDYVLLDYGETNISQFGYTNVWPKFDVPAEFIVYWNPETGVIYNDGAKLYKYNSNDSTAKWGIIKVAK